MGKTIRERNNHQSLRKLEEEEEEIFENWRWACAQGEQPHSMNERRRKKKKEKRRGFKVTKLHRNREMCVCVQEEVWHSVLCEMWMPVSQHTHKKECPLIFFLHLIGGCWKEGKTRGIWSKLEGGVLGKSMDKMKREEGNRKMMEIYKGPYFCV